MNRLTGELWGGPYNFRGEDKYLKLRVKLTTILGHFTVDYGVLKKLIKAMGLKVLLT